MRVLMLGWEFPPFKTGGLGTACFGLTRALDRAGHEIVFVLPRPIGQADSEHVTLLGPDALRPILTSPAPQSMIVPRAPAQTGPSTAGQRAAAARIGSVLGSSNQEAGSPEGGQALAGFERTRFFEIESRFTSPYHAGQPASGTPEHRRRLQELVEMFSLTNEADLPEWARSLPMAAAADVAVGLDAVEEMDKDTGNIYTHDLFGDADRYARMVVALAQRVHFDVVHAHDWLAFPAGMAVRARTGRPLVCHVHATEFDRSGDHINQGVYDIERAGVHSADRVIAVSKLTKEILVRRYGADPARVDVVYNGVDRDDEQPAEGAKIESDDKIVLFLGRITMQKGPEYFIRAAKRALEVMPNIKFVVAGSGDMALRMIDEAAALGIGHKVLFTGFLRGRDVDRVYSMADCYVMPSVSEPFGIAALEAIQRDVPTIISKQSGVSEVLTAVLKVDFWDVDDIANKIVAVLRHPPLTQTMREHGPMELRRLTWDDAARKTAASYGRALANGSF